MLIELTPEQKSALEKQHRKERDKRICDRIKAVLLRSEKWSLEDIAQALRIHMETVRTHLEEYQTETKLKPKNGGSKSALNAEQTDALIKHLNTKTYLKVSDICKYVKEVFEIDYTIVGITNWLHRNGFSYKKPHATPAKADPLKQKEFVDFYQKLIKETPEDEPVEFGDGVHPTMATKITYGWIRTGTDKPIATTASRSRLNLFGSLNLKTMGLTLNEYKTIDSLALEDHFKKLKEKYPNSKKIHLILDNGPYNKSKATQDVAKEYGVQLHFLSTYSPNLNPIERLWKVMNEHVRNNVFFESVKDFRKAVLAFFKETWPEISMKMKGRINDQFRIINSTSSC